MVQTSLRANGETSGETSYFDSPCEPTRNDARGQGLRVKDVELRMVEPIIKERNALEIETVTLMEKRFRRLLFRCNFDRSV